MLEVMSVWADEPHSRCVMGLSIHQQQLPILPKPAAWCSAAGTRPIVSLGSDSIAIFKGPSQRRQQGGRKRARHQAVKLCFKPVNFELHKVLQVSQAE